MEVSGGFSVGKDVASASATREIVSIWLELLFAGSEALSGPRRTGCLTGEIRNILTEHVSVGFNLEGADHDGPGPYCKEWLQ